MNDWSPTFDGQRPPFAPGNDLRTTHGAYSPRRLLTLAEEVYAELRESLEPWDPAFELPTRAVAEIRARKVLALRWLDEQGLVDGKGEPRPILREVPKWEARELELARELAMTIRSRAALELDRLEAMKDRIALAEVQPVLTAFARIAVTQCAPERRAETQRLLEEAAAGLVALERPREADQDADGGS